MYECKRKVRAYSQLPGEQGPADVYLMIAAFKL